MPAAGETLHLKAHLNSGYSSEAGADVLHQPPPHAHPQPLVTNSARQRRGGFLLTAAALQMGHNGAGYSSASASAAAALARLGGSLGCSARGPDVNPVGLGLGFWADLSTRALSPEPSGGGAPRHRAPPAQSPGRASRTPARALRKGPARGGGGGGGVRQRAAAAAAGALMLPAAALVPKMVCSSMYFPVCLSPEPWWYSVEAAGSAD